MFQIGPLSGMMLFWIVAIVVLIIAEVMTSALTTIWFVGGAIIAAILSAVSAPVYLQIIVFIIVSGALLALIRPYALKHFNPERTPTNVDAMIGKQGIVTEEINNAAQTGKVKVDGMDWSARALIHEQVIGKEKLVTVEKIDGVKLIVRPDAEA